MRTYFIAATQLGPNLTPNEVTSHVVRSIRVAHPKLTSANVIQLPLVDGGPGTIEHLVRLSLGSFLEVEVKDATGAESIVPLGFVGESNHMAIIETSEVCAVEQAGTIGTTAGIGELILDALDEGSFSVLIGISEPIARDYGCGLAQTLGVKFFDAQDRLLDIIASPSSVVEIARMDATGRSFQIMSARFFGARSESSRALLDATTDIFEDECLARLITIAQTDLGKNISTDTIANSGSAVEFGLQAFLNASILDGGPLMFEAGEIEKLIASSDDPRLVLVVDPTFCGSHTEVSMALSQLGKLATGLKMSALWIAPDSKTAVPADLVTASGPDSKVSYLTEAKLFRAPLTAKSTPAEIRADHIARLDKLIPVLVAAD